MYLGLLFRWSWRCPAAERRWSANRSHLHATRACGCLCLARARRFRSLPGAPRWRPWSAEGTRAAVPCARAGALPAIEPWRGRRLDNHREDVATYQGRVRRPGRPVPGQPARPACAGLPRCRSGGPPAGLPGPGRDGQQKWQTVYPGSRTCRRSAPPA